ncbi:MAG TPA: LPS biosynthesis protein WbpP, partial [Bacteroidetes bacterium]|nr:LPS biosynthesis protein WbpP [Bacteroidota bacterium]
MYSESFHSGENIEEYSFLITGGAGFIGSHIVEYLMHHGAKKVRVLDNLLTGNIENLQPYLNHPNFEFIEGDINDLATCHKACEGMDFLSHQAALGSVPRSIKDPIRTNHINIDGFLNIMVAAKESSIQRVVYASSSSVYGDEKTLPKTEQRVGTPLSPYAVSKKCNELYAGVFGLAYGMKIIGLRYFNVFGPRQDPNGPYAAVIPIFIDRSLENEEVYIDGDGLQTRDFTFVANAVQANIRSLFTEDTDAFGKVYNIAYGERFSILSMYETICGA